jgi:hypothetical protein
MAVTTQTMTDQQRRSVAVEYLKAFDNGGVTSTGGSNWSCSGSDLIVCEGTSHGEHADGPWRAGVPEHGVGR